MIPTVQSFPNVLQIADPLSVHFTGFNARAFEILEALRERPHIETYKAFKGDINTCIKRPFAQFRDDLVVNWVLPSQLPFEAERNVFSRLLKNDFGKGGSHHHIWMAFYRNGLRRLGDIQLAHTVRHNGFSTSLYVGDNAPELLRSIRAYITSNATPFLEKNNELLSEEGWFFRVKPGKAQQGEYLEFDSELKKLPVEISGARGIWWSQFIAKEQIIGKGEQHMHWTLKCIQSVWPLYLFLLTALEKNT